MNLKVKSLRINAPANPSIGHALGLIEPAALEALRQRSNGPALRHLGGHLVLLAVSGAAVLWAPDWPSWLAASVIYGIALTFLFTLEHETIHNSAFASDRLNRIVSILAGIAVVVPARWFRYFHFAHHRHTQDPVRDPELATQKPASWPQYLVYLTALPYWAATVRTLVRLTSGRIEGNYVPRARHADVVREARLHLAVYAGVALVSLATGSLLTVKLWLVPLLLGQPFLRAYLLAEHGACPLVADMLENARTTFTGSAIRFIAWNMPYHTAHHAFPTIPFHRLAEATALIRGGIAVTAQGYLDAHRQIRAGWPTH